MTALARLLQMHDSAFPVGTFAHSGGLEAYAQEGMDPDGLERYLAAQIDLGWGRLELGAWHLAWRDPSPAALGAQNDRASAWMVVPSLRDASLRRGARTLRLASRLWPDVADAWPRTPLHQAIVGGALAARLGIGAPDGLLAFAHGTLSASVAAATRCMALSPERAQEILVALTPRLVTAVDRALDDPDAQMFSATIGADVAAVRQTRLRTRLFQS